jgi:hypothetical protein
MRSLELSELPEDFQARLKHVCSSDANVRMVWLAWMTSVDGPDELFTILALDRQDEASLRGFIARVDALGGPRCVAGFPSGKPQFAPFYARPGAA